MSQNAPTIYPALTYHDATAAIEWITRVFGFETLMNVPEPDGTIAHAEMCFGAGVIMLGTVREGDEQRTKGQSALNNGLYVYVEDLESHYQHAQAEGAQITRELGDTDYGTREYSARDLEGNNWHFGTYRPSSNS